MFKQSLSAIALLSIFSLAGACAVDYAGDDMDEVPPGDPDPDPEPQPDPDPDSDPDPDIDPTPALVRVTVIDVFGNPAPGAHVMLQAADGTLVKHQISDAQGIVEGELAANGSATIAGQAGLGGAYEMITLGSLREDSNITLPDPQGGTSIEFDIPAFSSTAGDVSYRVRAGCNQSVDTDTAGPASLYLWRPSCALGDVVQIFAEARVNNRTVAYSYVSNVPLATTEQQLGPWLSGNKFKSIEIDVTHVNALPAGWKNYSGNGSLIESGSRFRLAAGSFRTTASDPNPTTKLARKFGTPVIRSRAAYKANDDTVLAKATVMRSLGADEALQSIVPLSYEQLPMPTMVSAGGITETGVSTRPQLDWTTHGIELEATDASLAASWFGPQGTLHRWQIIDKPLSFAGTYQLPAIPESLGEHQPSSTFREITVTYSRTQTDGVELAVHEPEQWPRTLGETFVKSERQVFFY